MELRITKLTVRKKLNIFFYIEYFLKSFYNLILNTEINNFPKFKMNQTRTYGEFRILNFVKRGSYNFRRDTR